MADNSCSESDNGIKYGKDGHKELVSAGSKALLNNSPLEAAELYEAALDKMTSKSSQKLRILQVVLRYALCIAWINCNDKLHLKKASECLSELLEAEQGPKIPAIYLALAKVYFSLKRFKKALDAIEKGLKVIRHHPEFKQHSWPGLQTPIKETEKNFLVKEFERLQKDCTNCPPPDAICRYEKCLDFSNHLFPSQEIYFTDPDFKQFILLQCDANCETVYHDTCSKNLMSNPEDFLGSLCTSGRCPNNGSIIVKVQIFGTDGFDHPIQTWQPQPETSNGSVDNCCVSALQRESTSPAQHNSQNQDSQSPSFQEKKSGNMTPVKYFSGLPIRNNLVSQSPLCFAATNTAYQQPNLATYFTFPFAPASVPPYPNPTFLPRPRPPRPPFGPFSSPNPTFLPRTRPLPPPFVPFSNPTPSILYQNASPVINPTLRMAPQQGPLCPAPSNPPITNVEVVVRNPAFLEAGTKLLVPIGPLGGQVQIVPHLQSSINKTEIKGPLQNSDVAVLHHAPSVTSVDPTNSKVGPAPISYSSSCTTSASEEVSIRSITEEFKAMVHGLAKGAIKEEHKINLNYQASTLQAKSLNSQAKESLHHADQHFIISSSLVSSLCSSQDDIRSESFDNSQFDSLLEVLKECREIKFGYLDEDNVNPELQCFGHPLTDHSTYVEPDEIDKADEAHADFVFSYYYSMFANNGPYKIDDLQETWKNTSDDLSLPESFTNKYPNLSEFLLKSERFAAIDDIIGTSDLLPDMFSKAEKELAESVSYFLFSQVIKPCILKENKSQDFCNDISNSCPAVDPFKFNFVDDCKDSYTSEEDKDCYMCENSGSEIGNNNSKALPFNPNNFATTTGFNGCLKPTSAPFVPRAVKTKSEVVYMSDDDEEIEVSLGDIDTEDNSTRNITNKVSVSEEEIPVVSYTRSQEISQPELKNSSMQTDMITDPEKVNLLKEREMLKKEVSELSYEKAELLQRLESLQIQIEANESLSANLEAQHTSALQQIQEKLLKKSAKVKELKELGSGLNVEVIQLKERLEEKENQVIERENSLDKLRRSHAKEINNFVKTLQEKKLYKDEEYLKLWKDFCEFKIKKFNHLCNDRIIVLQQLKDMMSDTAPPTKSDIKSSIEKYEEFIISATKKNAEVNDVYNREFERLKNGSPVKLPPVIEVPDISNMLYPPEGAFEYLLKPKQEEFAVPQNHFSPAFQSRFFPPYSLNGPQAREQELQPQGHAGVASSSLFSHGLADVSNLWNNGAFPNLSSTTPVVSSPGVSYDSPKVNGPHLIHQGFAPTNSMMPLQPPMNLLSNIMPYHPNSHSTAVQGFMGQNRTSPSPSLPFSSVNGSVFNTSSAVGGGAGVIQKPVSSTPALSPTVKNMPQAVVPITPVIAQGAIPKPRVQTATAALTPITPSKTTSRPVSKGTKSNESNYEKLMRNLQKMFPNRSDADLSQALKLAREKNGNSLSSLSHSEIVAKVEDVLNKYFRKPTSIGWEKFGQAAWGTAKPKVVEWEGAAQDECVICCEPLHSKEVYTLECKHDFHKDCIKKWLNQESICPNCRKHSTMIDEFPPLG